MQDKEFIQYRYVKPFPFKTFQDQRDFVQNELLSIIIIIFTGNPHFPNCFSYLFFKSVVVDVFPEKRQVELSFIGLRTSCVSSHYCGIYSEKYQNTLVPKYFLGFVPL